ncbi:protein-L-isoaspartate(D-aspartate) O-methyltransferase [Faunimonas pinastri]|uniref:Protein-L-isoaspartate O-methyltransferase n=1 Tax=Faunimonas pinastri TaxID=1855383 RepID=A0A1H9CRQ7_9HYPH|nr:protein-L-isoaspartate(D-aspartate) O-methyltransferase [Faunimonas pinastri]SEQ03910.1 protein-L-isoaspartate(D-aspartate) O-methyltransferase [Faunimonas pinastri]
MTDHTQDGALDSALDGAQGGSGREGDQALHIAALMLKLRGLGVTDRKVLKAVETVPRALFVPAPWQSVAYEDREIPIDCGQTLMPPSLVGRMTAALEVGDRHSVLEIGTGSGYQTAILARLARRVTSIDRFRTLVRDAEARWSTLGINNISAVAADGLQGWPRQAPFDRILVGAAVLAAPSRLISQLTDNGILVVPVGPGDGVQRLTLFQRMGQSVDTRDLGGVRFSAAQSGVASSL